MAEGHLRNGVLWDNAVVINYGGEQRPAEVGLHERADRLIQLIRPDPSPEFSRTRVPR